MGNCNGKKNIVTEFSINSSIKTDHKKYDLVTSINNVISKPIDIQYNRVTNSHYIRTKLYKSRTL